MLTFASAPNFEAPADADADNAYVVVVRAASGTGGRVKTADQTITVTVTDVAGEAPGVPAAPMVTSASVTSVTAAWAVPANAGPPITDYDYRYRVTSPQGSWTEVTNTAITGLSATITMLAEDTEYDVQVRATNDEGTSGWSLSGSGSTDTNAAPSFTSPATFDAAENQTAVGTVVASDGDADDGVTGYTIQGGADRSKFSIVEATGVLTFASAPNFEAPADADADNAYVVVVRAASGTGGRVKTADQTITVTVTDVAGEAPGVPAAPMVTSASVTSVTAAWAVPANAGPPITDYDYRYRVTSPQGSWTEVTNTAITGLSATITMLAEDTEYDVQVRATNDEGTSGWSLSGSGSTDTNAAPSFTSPATFDAAENQTAVGTVVASDGDADDGVTGYTIQGGADRSKFSIVEATGVLTFASAPNFEAPADADADNAYVVVVRAASGTGGRVKTADQTITVTVTDVAGEAPGVPAAPMVTSASVTSVTAAWAVPANAGPPITDYDYRYRVTSPQGSWTEVTNTAITGLSATITMLAEDTEYDVQVRATNDEGTSGWSLSGSGSTDTNAAPSFTSPATFDAAENQTAVGTVVASDGDADDGVTGYTIQGGADRSKFSIVEATGVLTFASAPNFEAPADADADNAYVVVVRAASGTGGRVKTADQTITVTVTDVAGEAPGVPAAPMVTSASVTSVTAAWAVPANAGPPITDYDYRYRVTSPQGSWTEVTNTAITGLSATITMLAEDTEYDVQVRATNDEGTSGWSLSGSGSTDANAAPSFTSPNAMRSVAENTPAGQNVGLALTATDADNDPLTYTLEGSDAASFDIVRTSGQILTKTGVIYDYETKSTYAVTVKADDGNGGTATIAVTISVTDVNEPVGPATDLRVRAGDQQVTLRWTAPANTGGDPITDYEYEQDGSGSWSSTGSTGTSYTVRNLTNGQTYTFRVRAVYGSNVSGTPSAGSASVTPAAGGGGDGGGGGGGDGGGVTLSVTLTLGPVTVSESVGSDGQPVTVTGTLNGGTSTEAMVVTVSVAAGTATETTDYAPVTDDTLTIPAGETSGTATFTLFPVDDDVDEDDETVTVSGTAASGLTVTPTSLTVTIADDDERGVVAHPTALTVAEGGSGEYTVVLSSEPTGPVTVEVTVSGSPDVTALPVTKTFTPSEWNVPQTVTVSVAHDGDAVNDTATVSHTVSGGDYGGVTAESVEVTVTEAATEAATESTEVTLTLSPAVVSEGAGSAGQTVTVTGTLNSGTRAEATVVTVTVRDGTATAGNDFTPVTGFTLTIPADATSGTTTFTLVPVDDDVDEDDETLTVSGTTTSGLTVTPTSLTVTIADDEDAPALSVADAQGSEDGGSIAFTVTLGGASSKAVTVDWETSDGTATAGRDYEAVSGTLTFAPHQTERLVTVRVLDDAVDEAEERFGLRLSNPVNAVLGDAEAVGTIVAGRDGLPKAWLARFGRTAAGHVLDAVGERLRSTRGTVRAEIAANGLEVTVAGRRLGPTLDGAAQDGIAALSSWMPEETGPDTSPASPAGAARPPSGRDLLAGSAFRYRGAAGADGTWSLWGGGAFSRFDGREEDVELDGEVLTGTVGIDFARNRWLTGLVLSQSRGDGVFSSSSNSGDLESSLTGLYPYLRYQASRRVSVWGLGGYGKGTQALAAEQQTDMAMTMTAAGIRGELYSPTDGRGLSLALATDALWLRATSDAAESVLAAEAEVSRLRLRIEGSYGGSLAPTFEVGVRQDAGDAETGFGLEVGGGLRYAARGLTANLGVRGLVAHEDQDFQEQGVVGSIIYDPNPSSDLGLSFALSPSWGAASSGGGTDALWARETMNGMARTDAHMPGSRLDAELGYGVAVFGGRGVVTPYTGLVVSEGSRRDLHLGWRLNCGSYCNLMLGLKRPESAIRNVLNEYSVMLQARLEGNPVSELYALGRSVLDRH